LGCWIFLRIFNEEKKHKHVHVHSNEHPIIHQHHHIHHQNFEHTHAHPNLKQGNIASLTVGFVHGLAGVAHFLLFLPVIGFATRIDSIKYIVGFAIGTLLAMVSFAMVIGKLSEFSKKEHNVTFFKGIRLAGGLFAFIIGIYWFFAN
jgi:ABC-type nickel/cobalt efflux system permease component RcnA